MQTRAPTNAAELNGISKPALVHQRLSREVTRELARGADGRASWADLAEGNRWPKPNTKLALSKLV